MLTLHTLGECRLTITPARGETVTLAPDAGRLFALALLLAAERGRPVPRGQLADWVWPDLAPAAGRRCLRQALYRLRAAGLPVASDDDHLCLARAAVAPTFAAAPSPATLRDAWAGGALRLGRCLPGWSPPGDALAAWLDAYRDRVEGAVRRALDDALTRARRGAWPAAPEAGGDADGEPPALPLARALLALDPDHPGALAVAGARAGAAAVREGAPAVYAGAVAAPVVDPALGESLGVLAARLAAARAGAGGLVVLAGPPGPEPSGLLTAFADAARGVRVVYVDAAPWAAGPRAPGAGLPLAVARALAAGSPAGSAQLTRGGVASVDPEAGAAVLRRVGAAAAASGPVVVCLDHAEYAGAEALAAVAAAAAGWAEVPALLVVACAGAWPAGAAGGGGPAEGACGSAARRWGARLAEVAEAVAGGRPLLVRVAPVR